jgi:tRNA(fMet)-specific endonuclease VapC
MSGFLLDTNHLGAALRRVSLVRDRIQQRRRAGIKIGTCIPALCELEVGIRQISRQEEGRRDLNLLMNHIRVWLIDQSIVASYGEIHEELRRRGRVLSQVDMMLTSLARVMNLTILTTDRDFEALPDIRTEDWTINVD